MQKSELKIFIFQWDICRIQANKALTGFHGETDKLNLSRGEAENDVAFKSGNTFLIDLRSLPSLLSMEWKQTD